MGLRAKRFFVGYGLQVEDHYTNFTDDTDLTGKVAVFFRFEPMDENRREPMVAAAGRVMHLLPTKSQPSVLGTRLPL